MDLSDCQVAKIADQVCNCKPQNFKFALWSAHRFQKQLRHGRRIIIADCNDQKEKNLEPSSTNRAPISKVAVLSLHMYILEIPLHFTSVRQWRGIRHVPCSLNVSSETTIHCTIP